MIGGIIGGAATALAASFFWIGGDDGTTATLETRLTEAEQQVSQVETLTERIAAIEAPPAEAATAGDDVAARFTDLEAKLDALAGNTTAGGGDDFGERIAALQEQLDGLAGLEQKVEALAGEVQTASQARQANTATLLGLEGTLPTLEATLAATGTTVEQTTAETSALNQSVETLSGDMQSLATRIDETEGRLDYIGGEYQRGAAMIVAIGDVDRAIAKAEPFESSLQSLKLLLRDDQALGGSISVLEPMAAEGVPTLSDLKGGYGSMASAVLLADEGEKSLTDQVSNNVFGILNIRPSGGDVAGTSSRAILARAQARLSADDLDGVINELAALEGTAAGEAAGWVAKARGRLSAEAAVVDLRAHAQALVAQGS